MADKSKIEWTNATWNPIAGCTKCSPGCLNCYAERMAWRLQNIGIYPYHQHPDLEPITKRGWTGIITCNDKSLDQPLHWRKPRLIFVCSMSDLFHPKVPFKFITHINDRIDVCQQHTFQILTKRIERAKEYYLQELGGRIPENIHLNVSISTQAEADEKIPILLQIPAAVRGLSIEPMLEGIDLHILDSRKDILWRRTHGGSYERQFLHWVIVGCESGPKRRPCKIEWVQSIVDQCKASNVPCFVKQINVNGKVVKMPKVYPQEYPITKKVKDDEICTEKRR